MKHQLQTIREALEFFECGSYSTSKALTAITAFAQLEAMVGEQEPVSGVVLRDDWPTLLLDRDIKPTDERLYRAAPPAQQPQQVQAFRSPAKTEWGCGMVSIDIELDKDSTATVFFDREDTAKVEQRFDVGVKHV